METVKPQFEIVNILFLESNFQRSRIFNPSKEITINLDVQKSININGDPIVPNGQNTIVVDLIVKIIGLQDNSEKVYDCNVLAVGVFEPVGDENINKEIFANVNAPAIIYPFIREHIASLTQKAGLSLFLPPLNFVKLHEDHVKR